MKSTDNRKVKFISTELLCRIGEIADRVFLSTDGIVMFEEYILLPYYGNIVLRFDLKLNEYTIDDLDEYESIIYKITGDEFLIDFMGSVYRKVGMSYDNFNNTLRVCAAKLREEPILPSVYSKDMINVTNQLKELLGLSENEKIWEVQPDDEPLILLLAKQEGNIEKLYVAGQCYHIGKVDELCCEGLMRAAFCAKRTRCSLARILIENIADNM